MLRQVRLLYCRSNSLVRLFSKRSKTVLIELCRSFAQRAVRESVSILDPI